MRRKPSSTFRVQPSVRPLSGRPAARSNRLVRYNKRSRGQRNVELPFVPPETWHEPHEKGNGKFRVFVEDPSPGYRHVLTPGDVRARLAMLPAEFTRGLEVVQFSRMTRKKRSFPCYGMQWGATIYLYPIEENLIEHFDHQPKPDVINESRMYGGRWEQGPGTSWQLIWTEKSLRDFYLHNILIHELGHLVDTRNSSYLERERYAEWFAIQYGYRAWKRRA